MERATGTAGRRPAAAALRFPLLLASLSGAGTFALQVLWNRAFAQVHENSTFSFALIVAVFIAAIAAGAELARRLLRQKVPIRAALGGLWICGGLLVVISLSEQLREC